MSALLFKTAIPGRVVSKKNNKRIARNSRRLYVLSSEQYLTWARHSLLELKSSAFFLEKKPIAGPLEVHIRFFFKNRKHEMDIDNCLGGPLDVLQQAGIIENDKQILKLKAEKLFGEEPRTEIEIFKHEEL